MSRSVLPARQPSPPSTVFGEIFTTLDKSTTSVPEARHRLRSPYWPVISHPILRRVLPGFAVSAIGDGMALVAVTLLTLQLVPRDNPGPWVGLALAAYTGPSAVGTLLFGRFLRHRNGLVIAGWDAVLRASALAAIPVAYLFGVLTIGLYVALLALSSLLHAWGSAGRYTLVAQLLPERHHLPANAVLTTITEFATIVGPPLAGLIVVWGGPVTVIAVDAGTFALLVITYRMALPRLRTASPLDSDTTLERSKSMSGFGVVRRDRTLLGLLLLTFTFFLSFGPVLAALPIYVVTELHGSALLLSSYYTAFGVGAVAGGLVTGYLRRLPLVSTVVGTVLAFGVAMLPLGLGVPLGFGLVCFGVAGVFWPPYSASSLALLQRKTSKEALASVLAANGVIGVLAVPLGTIPGGLLVDALGARETLLVSATLILAIGATAILFAATTRFGPAKDHRGHAQPSPGHAGSRH